MALLFAFIALLLIAPDTAEGKLLILGVSALIAVHAWIFR